MNSYTRMTPRVASEVSSRLNALDPSIREFFALPSITMTGKGIEDFARAVWMVGYGSAISDICELPGEMPDLAPLLETWGWEA